MEFGGNVKKRVRWLAQAKKDVRRVNENGRHTCIVDANKENAIWVKYGRCQRNISGNVE